MHVPARLPPPPLQEELVRAVARSGVPVVVVAVAGGPLDLSPLLGLQGVAAVLAAPYGGQQVGVCMRVCGGGGL